MPHEIPEHLVTPEWEEGLTLLADMILRSGMEEQAETWRQQEHTGEVVTKKRTRKRPTAE